MADVQEAIVARIYQHDHGISLHDLQADFGTQVVLELPEFLQQCTVILHHPERDVTRDVQCVTRFLQSTSQPWEHQLGHLKWVFPMFHSEHWDTLVQHPHFRFHNGGLHLARVQRRSTCAEEVLQLFPTTTDVIPFQDLVARATCSQAVLSNILRKLVRQKKLRMYTRRGRGYRRLATGMSSHPSISRKNPTSPFE